MTLGTKPSFQEDFDKVHNFFGSEKTRTILYLIASCFIIGFLMVGVGEWHSLSYSHHSIQEDKIETGFSPSETWAIILDGNITQILNNQENNGTSEIR